MDNKKQFYITIGILCALLAIGISIQLKTIRNTNAVIPVGDSEEDELRNEVISWKEKYDEAVAELESTEKDLKMQRELATKDNSEYTEMEEQIKFANTYLGLTEVTGKGVVVTLKDNQEVNADTPGVLDVSDYLVHDGDIIQVINELKNAGAEAISINNERIISTTSITCDGTVILINGNKISSPFTIKAIGSPALILGAIQRTGGLLEELDAYGLVSSISQEENVTIYKYSGVIE